MRLALENQKKEAEQYRAIYQQQAQHHLEELGFARKVMGWSKFSEFIGIQALVGAATMGLANGMAGGAAAVTMGDRIACGMLVTVLKKTGEAGLDAAGTDKAVDITSKKYFKDLGGALLVAAVTGGFMSMAPGEQIVGGTIQASKMFTTGMIAAGKYSRSPDFLDKVRDLVQRMDVREEVRKQANGAGKKMAQWARDNQDAVCSEVVAAAGRIDYKAKLPNLARNTEAFSQDMVYGLQSFRYRPGQAENRKPSEIIREHAVGFAGYQAYATLWDQQLSRYQALEAASTHAEALLSQNWVEVAGSNNWVLR